MTNRPMKKINSQAGWTMWSLLFVLATIGFFSYVGMKLVPMFSENSSIVNAMERSVANVDVRKVTRAKIIQAMEKQLYQDGADEIVDYKKDFKITRSRSQFKMELDYTREVPLFANIGVIASFNPILECDLGGKCEKK